MTTKCKSLEDKKPFKKAMLDLFFRYNKFMIDCILLSEKFWAPKFLNGRDEFQSLLLQQIRFASSKTRLAFREVFDNLIAELKKLTFLPDFEEEVVDFKEEQDLIKAQFERMKDMDYEKQLNFSPNFLAKLEDFVCVVKPDGRFELPAGLDLKAERKRYSNFAEIHPLELKGHASITKVAEGGFSTGTGQDGVGGVSGEVILVDFSLFFGFFLKTCC